MTSYKNPISSDAIKAARKELRAARPDAEIELGALGVRLNWLRAAVLLLIAGLSYAMVAAYAYYGKTLAAADGDAGHQ